MPAHFPVMVALLVFCAVAVFYAAVRLFQHRRRTRSPEAAYWKRPLSTPRVNWAVRKLKRGVRPEPRRRFGPYLSDTPMALGDYYGQAPSAHSHHPHLGHSHDSGNTGGWHDAGASDPSAGGGHHGGHGS